MTTVVTPTMSSSIDFSKLGEIFDVTPNTKYREVPNRNMPNI